MNDTLLFSLVMLAAVFISSCSQLLLKKEAQKTHESRLKEYLNPRVVIAYGFFFFAKLVNVFALKYVPLSFAPVIESCGYIFVAILGYLFLKEKFNRRKLAGMAVIIAGVLLFSL